MNSQLNTWKRNAEQLWSAPTFDCREAAKFAAAVIQNRDTPRPLIAAAKQALPSLHAVAIGRAGPLAKGIARRRFGIVRDVLYELTSTSFGRSHPSSLEAAYRRLLGLSPQKRLARSSIEAAFRRRAKEAHPDGGGTSDAFMRLVTARDKLLKNV